MSSDKMLWTNLEVECLLHVISTSNVVQLLMRSNPRQQCPAFVNIKKRLANEGIDRSTGQIMFKFIRLKQIFFSTLRTYGEKPPSRFRPPFFIEFMKLWESVGKPYPLCDENAKSKETNLEIKKENNTEDMTEIQEDNDSEQTSKSSDVICMGSMDTDERLNTPISISSTESTVHFGQTTSTDQEDEKEHSSAKIISKTADEESRAVVADQPGTSSGCILQRPTISIPTSVSSLLPRSGTIEDVFESLNVVRLDMEKAFLRVERRFDILERRLSTIEEHANVTTKKY